MTKQKDTSDWEVLRDRWVPKSFPSLRGSEFVEKFNQLIDDTLKNSKEFPPPIRAEILKNIFVFHDKYLSHSSRYFKDTVNKCRNDLFSAVIEVLDPGFEGEEITVDLLGEAGAVNDLKVLDAMLKAGIDSNSKFQRGLECFTNEWQTELFDRLLAAGSNPDLLVEGKIRQLLDFDVLKKISALGVDLDVVDEKGNTPLFYCMHAREAENTLRLLENAGCDIDHLNKVGETALSSEVAEVMRRSHPHSLSGICKDLVTIGADIHCPPNPSPLLVRLPKDPESYCSDDVLGFIDLLIKKKVSLDERDPLTGDTALHYWASTDGKMSRKICEKLIKAGADIGSLNNAGQTPLMRAAQQHAEKSWKLLCSKKADINARSANGYSVSEWCVAGGEEPPFSFLKLLLETGAPLDGGGADCDLSLLAFLIKNNHFSSAAMVIEYGGKITDLVVDSMGTNGQFGQKTNLELVSAFIASSGLGAEKAIETRYQDEIEKLLSDFPRLTSENPLKVLSPQCWPPIFQKRDRLIVNDVPVKLNQSKVDFIGDEYTEYLTATTGGRGGSYEKIEPKTTEDEDIAKKVRNLGKNQSLLFRRFILATDQTIADLWNNKISQRPSCLTFKNYGNSGVSISTPEFRYLLARCGISLLPGFLEISKGKPTVICRVLLPVAAPDVAPLMASQLLGSSVSRVAKKWFLRHREVAILGLLPSAVGKLGKERNNCETALRFMASSGLQSDIVELCKEYGPEVEASVNEILSVDTSFDYHQGTLPEIPDDVAKLDSENLKISGNGEPLPKPYMGGLLGMMSLSSYDSIYPALEKILSCFDSDSLSIFSWNVFQLWDKKWKEAEWMYHSLSYMGNDVTVKKLIPFINSWPKEGGMNKAVIGLDILSNIGSDYAIRSINSILLKTKYKPLLARSEEIMEKIAEVRGLTKAELDDRLVPTFGLEDSESFKLDFGARSFTIELNEKLVPQLLYQDNKKVKTLPKAAKGDDKARVKIATVFWNELKAGIKTEASTQLFRFEKSMLNGRQWTAIDFRSLLVAHPFLGSLVRSLVWAEVKDGKIDQLFRVDSDGIYLGADDNEIVLSNMARVCIPHPIYIKKALDDWQNVFAKNQLNQPFAQITRKVYLRKDDTAKDLFGIQGAKAPAKAFRGLKAKGWVPEIGDGGAIWSYEKSLSDGKARLGFEGILTMYDVGIDEDQKLEVTVSGKPSNVEYSEVIRELSDLLH